MLSRRTFLLGGAGAVVAAGVGVEVAGRERVLHRFGLSGSPDHRVPPSGWAVTEGRFPSGARWAFSRPDGEVRGLIVCLHGKGDTHRFAFDQIHLHDVVADEGAQLAVAAMDGGDGSYWHVRADGSDPGRALIDDLVSTVVERLGVNRVAVLGWSMGGYGALLAAERNPGTFGAVVASSPALFRSFAKSAPGAFDDAAQFAANDVTAGADHLHPERVRIDCGAQDPFAPTARDFAAHLGPDVTATFPRGYHDAAFWRSVAPAQVRFIADRL